MVFINFQHQNHPENTYNLTIAIEWNENVNGLVKMQLSETGRQKKKKTGGRKGRGLIYSSHKARSQQILSKTKNKEIEQK